VSVIRVTGTGAVSPAGWGAAALVDAVRDGVEIPVDAIERSAEGVMLKSPLRKVPKPADRSVIPKHPRLRRGSPIAKFAAAAAVEAIGAERMAAVTAGERSVGVIFTALNGCVNYSRRYFGEVLEDPSLASPILFPETVFNAPSSHLSALFGSTGQNDTIVGDSAAFLPALELATEWIERGDVDGCLVVGAEESDWLSAEGLGFYSRHYVAAEGAGALFLEASDEPDVQLTAVPDAVGLSAGREAAALELREALGVADDGSALLVDGRAGVGRWDRPEDQAWSGWSGPWASPRVVLGEGMGASSAWQAVVAVEMLRAGVAQRAVVSAVGGNQQAAGAVFEL
jgi:3-oxoacyl-(acyl-carrier-protein) synthase